MTQLTQSTGRGRPRLEFDQISDAELTALALAADPDAIPMEDVLPLWTLPEGSPGMLGAWYMPPIATRRVGGWRRWVVLSIVGTFLILEALGLCSVFGQVVIG